MSNLNLSINATATASVMDWVSLPFLFLESKYFKALFVHVQA